MQFVMDKWEQLVQIIEMIPSIDPVGSVSRYILLFRDQVGFYMVKNTHTQSMEQFIA